MATFCKFEGDLKYGKHINTATDIYGKNIFEKKHEKIKIWILVIYHKDDVPQFVTIVLFT